MDDTIIAPLSSAEIDLVNNCALALDVTITKLDIEFTDGTDLAGVPLGGALMTLPSERFCKPIKKISIPLEQHAGVRTKGYAGVSDRMNNNISIGTAVMMWMTTGRRCDQRPKATNATAKSAQKSKWQFWK